MNLYKVENGFLLGLLNGEAKDLKRIVERSVDASIEKHVPVVKVDGSRVIVNIGSIEHPMVDEHYIEFVAIKSEKGLQVKYLNPSDSPIVEFELVDDKFINAYAYCNLHGLWRNE